MTQNPDFYYTKFNNKVLEALCRYHCGEVKKQILILLIRQTSGFHREYACVSISQVAYAIKRERAWVGHAIRDLIQCKVVVSDGRGSGANPARRLKVNEKTEEWIPFRSSRKRHY